jgi:hypothetical protein
MFGGCKDGRSRPIELGGMQVTGSDDPATSRDGIEQNISAFVEWQLLIQ